MTKPTEVMEKTLKAAMAKRGWALCSCYRDSLRIILAAPQDYGLIVPPTRSQLEQAGHFSWNGHEEDDQYLGEKQIELLIAEKWATEDPIPEPAPVAWSYRSADGEFKMRWERVMHASTDYGTTWGDQASSILNAIMADPTLLPDQLVTQLAERGMGNE
jgi:hypothetical protein